MTLPASPPITAQDINVELGRSATAAFSIDGAEERALAGIPSGAISFSDFLGKSSQLALTLTDAGNEIDFNPGESTGTHTNRAIGTAAATRKVFVNVLWAASVTSRQLSSATIGGVSATILGQDSLSDGDDESIGAAIIVAEVPTGTTATIVLNYSGLVLMSRIRVYTTNGAYTVTETLTDTSTVIPTTLTANVAIDVAEGGLVLAAMVSSASGAGVGWTGATEEFDVDTTTFFPGRASGALSQGLSAQSNRTVQSQQTGVDSNGMVLVVTSLVKA